MRYKVAAVQMDSGENREENLYYMEGAIRRAAKNGADLVSFPETCEYIGKDRKGNASEIPGELTDRLCDMARQSNVMLHIGSVTEKNLFTTPYNTGLLIERDGKLLARYRKLHMYDVDVSDQVRMRESDVVSKGKDVVLADTEFGRMGLSICYDLRFPELYRVMARAGASVIFVPASFTYETGKAHWEPLLKARAIENTCYIVAAAQCGDKPKWKVFGNSMVIDPWGEVIARAGEDDPEIIYAEIDREKIREIRNKVPSLASVREDVYRLDARIRIYSEDNRTDMFD